MRKPPTVFVSAPQGAGKTRHAEALREMFGCTSIIDDGAWDGSSDVPAGALVLTHLPLRYVASANDDAPPSESDSTGEGVGHA